MEIIQLDYQHFIRMSDVQKEMDIDPQSFKNQINRYQWGKKRLEHEKVNGEPFVSCKSAFDFLTWYLEGSRLNPELNAFKHAISKYTKKIPKRVLSRSMRVEIAYRQSYKCRRCELFPIPPNFEVDHIIELHDGGKDVAENLQALCPACHREKTRLNRLRKNKIFQSSVQEDYNKFIRAPPGPRPPVRKRPEHVPMPKQIKIKGSKPKSNILIIEPQINNNTTDVQVFSKYFRKRKRSE